METGSDVRIRTVISESEDPILHFFFANIPSRDRAKVLKRIIRQAPLSALGMGVEELPPHLRAMYPMPNGTVSVSSEMSATQPISKQKPANPKEGVTNAPRSVATEQEEALPGFGLPAFLQGAEELGIFGGASK